MPKVLIVDDETDFLEVLSARLKRSGYAVITAADGKDGVSKLYSERPDLVLLDVMMPNLNGYELCRQIKSDQKLCKTPVVILSARGQRDDVLHGKEVGADAYFMKPFDSNDLISKIEHILGQVA
tara:strand:- start:219 stop:590 length:372 start_codon:yes stop_codon:yes gene_type:complete